MTIPGVLDSHFCHFLFCIAIRIGNKACQLFDFSVRIIPVPFLCSDLVTLVRNIVLCLQCYWNGCLATPIVPKLKFNINNTPCNCCFTPILMPKISIYMYCHFKIYHQTIDWKILSVPHFIIKDFCFKFWKIKCSERKHICCVFYMFCPRLRWPHNWPFSIKIWKQQREAEKSKPAHDVRMTSCTVDVT